MAAPLVNATKLADKQFDIIVFVNDEIADCGTDFKPMQTALSDFAKINRKLVDEVTVVPIAGHGNGRMVYCPTKALNTDFADARNVYDAACAGFKRAIDLGCKSPLLCVGPLKSANIGLPWMETKTMLLNAILGAYHAAYTPLEVREMVPDKYPKVKSIGVFQADEVLLKVASAIEEGRWIARDIGGSDPERMAAPAIEKYLDILTNCKGVTITREGVDGKKYPLMAAVDRAAALVTRHQGRVIHLKYDPPSGKEVDTTLFIIGKGITYDTGGADIKAGGVMAGMHRDKCGAAAIAGLFKTLSILQPQGLSVRASLAFVRNSVGVDSYVSDEIIVARSGKRVRIGNTDAEGRMVMGDLLCEAREEAVNAKNPFLFTVATLTGHVVRAYNTFTAIMDNGPARMKHVSQNLQLAGDRISDLAEVSTVRKEDFAFNKGKTEYEDLVQANTLPSSATPRGHQFPAAFLVDVSGLDKHGLDSKQPIPYTHVDVAGSAGAIFTQPTAAPLMMFVARYVLPRVGFENWTY